MKSVYLTAISPAKGSEGDLKKFLISCTNDFGWHSPLPLLVPLYLWRESFPRDRVNKKELRALPPLDLTGPVIYKNNIFLEMKDSGRFDSSLMFREIHGKSVPPKEITTFINWKGLLLNTSLQTQEIPVSQNMQKIQNMGINFHFRSWQLGLYKIRYDETRQWWQDLTVTPLWKVRKPS